MPKTTFPALVLLVLIAASVGAADRERLDLEVRFWEPDVSGAIQVVADGFGNEIDLQNDLGVGSDSFNDIRLTFRPSRRTSVRLSSVPIEFTGASVVDRTITFAGQTFTVSTTLDSRLSLDYYRAGFAWQFLSSSDGRFRIGPLIEVKGLQGDARLAATDLQPAPSVAESFEVAFGSAGVALDIEPSDRWHLFGEATTLVAADQGDETDLEAGLRVRVWRALYALAGYRSIDLRFDDAGDHVDVRIDGTFFGASLRF